jgi:hypothetical protein
MSWNNFSLASLGSAQSTSGIAAVSRIPNSMELWWVGSDGSTQGAYWYQGGDWQRYPLAPAGSASLTGGIAVVSRVPNSMELWFVGADGSIQDHYWYEGSSWQNFTLAPRGSASLTGGIAAVSRVPNSMELWFVGADGSIQGAYWYQGGSWQRYPLAPAGSASLTSSIAAVSRIPNSMELWWVGPDGSIQGAYWYQGGDWQRYPLAPAGSVAPAGSASLTSGIAVVSRVPNSMELWFVGADASIQDYYWYEGSSWQNFTLAPRGSAMLTSGIAAVSRVPNSMELWFVGLDGSIQDYYWYEGSNWQNFTLAPLFSVSLTSGVAAVSRVPNSMEVWFVGLDDSVWDNYWYQGPPATPALWSSNNYILVDGCTSLQNLTVTLHVTQDLITLGNTGFSLQLNSYPQPTSTSQGETLNWFQYVLYVGGVLNNQLGWEIQYWSVGAPSYGPNQPWPPGYNPNPPNTTPWLPVLPNDDVVQSFGSAPLNQIPAGSVMQIQLTTDSGGNVTAAEFSVTDPHGGISSAPFTFPGGAIFPIYGFQVDLVGPGGSSACTFVSGAGTFQYSVSAGALALQNTNTCGGAQPPTGETSNAVYGPVTPSSGLTVSQSLGYFWQGTPAAPGSALDGYWGSDNSQHVNFISLDGHVHELYIHPGASWVDIDLTAWANGTPAASGSALDGYWGSDSSQHVNFISLDGHVHELYTRPGSSWADNDLTAWANGTPAASGSALDGYWGSDNSQHVNFISLDGHVHELYTRPGSSWADNDLTAWANGTPAASGSALDGYWGSDNSQHVNFFSLDGHVHELYTRPGSSWADNDLTAWANGTPASPGSALDGYWGSDNSQHVNFISLDGHVHELYTRPGSSWADNDLTAWANGTPAAPPRPDSSGRSHTTARGSMIDGYWGSDSSQHVNFISLDGHVHELYTHPGSSWVDNDLSVHT